MATKGIRGNPWPKGHKYWMNRSKHGRNTLFASPELLRQAAFEYFEQCDNNPINDSRSFGQRDVQRPYTLHGLCVYIGCNPAYFRQFNAPEGSEFRNVIDEIEQTIYAHQFEHAAVGIFKENIIARALGLTEKTDNKNDNTNLLTGKVVVVKTASTGVPFANRETDVDAE